MQIKEPRDCISILRLEWYVVVKTTSGLLKDLVASDRFGDLKKQDLALALFCL